MKSAKQHTKGKTARARNIRGKKNGKGKKLSEGAENSFEQDEKTAQLIDDNSAQTSLGKIHAKVQREVEDKPGNDVQKKTNPDAGREDNEVAAKEETDSKISMKKDLQKTDNIGKQEADVPQYNTQYFTMEKSGDGLQLLYVKGTASAYEAIHDVIRNSRMYSIGSRELLSVATLFSKAKEMGKEKFDTGFVVRNPVCIRLK